MVFFYILCFILTGFFSGEAKAVANENRSRVEDLIVWKLSEELKLSVKEEKSFGEFFRDLSHRRTQNNVDIQSTIEKLSQAKSVGEKQKLLTEYRRLLKVYHSLSLEEIDHMQKLLGVDRAAQYLVAKSDLSLRVKNLLAVPTDRPTEKASEKKAEPRILPEPRIIEE